MSAFAPTNGLGCEMITSTHGWDFNIQRRGDVFPINTGSASMLSTLWVTPHHWSPYLNSQNFLYGLDISGKSKIILTHFASLIMGIWTSWHKENASGWKVKCKVVFPSSDEETERQSWFWPQTKYTLPKPHEYTGRRASRHGIVERIKRTGAHR